MSDCVSKEVARQLGRALLNNLQRLVGEELEKYIRHFVHEPAATWLIKEYPKLKKEHEDEEKAILDGALAKMSPIETEAVRRWNG